MRPTLKLCEIVNGSREIYLFFINPRIIWWNSRNYFKTMPTWAKHLWKRESQRDTAVHLLAGRLNSINTRQIIYITKFVLLFWGVNITSLYSYYLLWTYNSVWRSYRGWIKDVAMIKKKICIILHNSGYHWNGERLIHFHFFSFIQSLKATTTQYCFDEQNILTNLNGGLNMKNK